jgi:hypothetical protein
VRGGIDEDFATLVVEPHRRQARPPARAGNAERLRDRPVEEFAVDRVEIVETLCPAAFADHELAFLQTTRDIAKIGDEEAHRRLPVIVGGQYERYVRLLTA